MTHKDQLNDGLSGVSVGGAIGSVHGDIVGRDKIVGLTAEDVVDALIKKGIIRSAEADGLEQQTVIALARRLRPDTALNFEQAVAELERAVTVALKVRSEGQGRTGREYLVTTVAAQVGRSVGHVEVEYSEGGGATRSGTCFIIDESGYALTAGHLFDASLRKPLPSYSVSVIMPGCLQVAADLVTIDHELDIAVIKMPTAGYIPLRPGMLKEQSHIEFATVIGSSVDGYIRSTGAAHSEFRSDRLWLSMRLWPGSSGAPILDGDGLVIGVSQQTSVTGRSSGVRFDLLTALLSKIGLVHRP